MEADSSTSADVPNRNENMMRGKQKHVLNAPNKPCMTLRLYCFAIEVLLLKHKRFHMAGFCGRLGAED